MLDALRNATKSLVAKILFGILVLSFAVWGIGDIFRGGGFATVVAEVGDQRITAQEFTAEYQRFIEQLRPAFGGNLDTETARQLGFHHQVLQRMIGQAVFDQGAEDLNVEVSNEVIRAQIMADPRLHGPGGTFDPIAFREMLMKAGFTEEGFIDVMRRDIARNILIGAIRGTGEAPDIMVNALFRLRAETRTADYVEIDAGAFDDVGEPDDAAVQGYYEENQAIFTAPEYRTVTYVAITTQDLAKTIEIADDELREAYEERKGRYSTPERRRLQQMVLTDKTDAVRAKEMLEKGNDFAQVAKDVANQSDDAIELGVVVAEEIPPDLRDAAFGHSEGQISDPVQTAFGWHIINVVEVMPRTVQAFEEVKDELRQELAEEHARDEIEGLTNRLEDALAGGATIEEAAAQLGLTIQTIEAVDVRGMDESARPIEGLPNGLAAAAFESQEGLPSPLTPIGTEGYFVLRVDKVTPSAVRPLEQVRDVVVSGWKGEERLKRAEARAAEIADKLGAGQSLRDVAAEYGLTVRTSAPFQRGQSEVFSKDMIGALFDGEPGSVATGESPSGFLVGVVTSVAPADPAENKETLSELRRQLDDAAGTDYLVQYGAALEDQFEIQVNEERLNSLF